MSEPQKDFVVYEHHAKDLGVFTITPLEGTLVGSKAFFRVGYRDETIVDLDSTISTEISWSVDVATGVATGNLNLSATTIDSLRYGENEWQLTIELQSGHQIVGVFGVIDKKRALDAL